MDGVGSRNAGFHGMRSCRSAFRRTTASNTKAAKTQRARRIRLKPLPARSPRRHRGHREKHSGRILSVFSVPLCPLCRMRRGFCRSAFRRTSIPERGLQRIFVVNRVGVALKGDLQGAAISSSKRSGVFTASGSCRSAFRRTSIPERMLQCSVMGCHVRAVMNRHDGSPPGAFMRNRTPIPSRESCSVLPRERKPCHP